MSAQLDRATTYRKLNDADLDQVLSIENAVHLHPWTRGNFADSLDAGYHCWIAERDTQLVGYGVVMVGAGDAHLLNLSVSPHWQRNGVGRDLTHFFLKLARDYGAERMYLEVRPSNTAARALYASSGFEEVGIRRDYYPAGPGREDAVVMELRLQ